MFKFQVGNVVMLNEKYLAIYSTREHPEYLHEQLKVLKITCTLGVETVWLSNGVIISSHFVTKVPEGAERV